MSDHRPQRRARLLDSVARQRAESILVSFLPNVRYLCGFTGSNGLLLITPKTAILFTDPRYEIQAAQECDCEVKIVKGSPWPAAATEARRRHVPRLALEADKVSFDQWSAFASQLGKKVSLVPVRELVEALRAVKSQDEIAAIRRSVQVCSKAFTQTVRKIRPGMAEFEVAAELDHRMRMLGAEAPAFETIVASGPRTALPHARPGAGTLRPNQLLLVDMGASVAGYSSDMTRVLHIGHPGTRARALYHAVLEAQLAAISAVRPGATCGDVDNAARRSLRKAKLDRYFTHSTGHGLGLEIHEAPRVAARTETRLQPGMVITIEPGVYLEEFGGVRIEDTVLVTETGVEVLTPTTKEFLVIPS